MVNRSFSPNLAPWNWKIEGAPRTINDEPAASQSAPDSVALPIKSNEPLSMKPTASNYQVLPLVGQPAVSNEGGLSPSKQGQILKQIDIAVKEDAK